jgi:hypothetical protein
MASFKIGFIAQFTRFILAIINVIFLLVGLVVFITAIVLRWGSTSFNKLINIPDINKVIDSASQISGVTIFLLILGGFIILLSVFGLLGIKYMNRFFLIIYEIVVVIIFLAQIIALLVLVFSSSTIETEYRKGLNKTIENINSHPANATDDCALMKSLSNLFDCCGANGPQDFKNVTLVTGQICCSKPSLIQKGCADRSVDDIETNVINLVVIPSSVILGIEFFAMLMVPFLVGKAGAAKRDDYESYGYNPTTSTRNKF